MSFRLVKIKEDSFFKEVMWALFILLLTFLPYLHLLASDVFTKLKILGFEYVHGLGDNQAFVWFILIYVQLLGFLLLIASQKDSYIKLALFLPVYWTIFGLFFTICPKDFYKSFKFIFQLASAFISFFLMLKLGYRKVKNWKLEFKLNNVEIWTIILFTVLTIATITFERMSNTLKQLDVFGYIITPHGFESIPNFLWVLSYKLLLLTALATLFLQIKVWWKYVFVLPILITTYQINTVIFSDSEVMDEYEITQALPLLLLVLILLLFLSRSAYYNAKLKSLYKKTFSQIEKKRVMAIKDQLGIIKKRWKETLSFNDKKENIVELRAFKKELEKQLKEL